MGKKESRNALNTDENAAPSSLAFHWPGLEGYEALGLEGSRTPQHRFFHYYEERNKIEREMTRIVNSQEIRELHWTKVVERSPPSF